MRDKEIEVLCKDGCGETFSAFLRDMKERNTKVVCPKCGKAHDVPGSKDVRQGGPGKRV